MRRIIVVSIIALSLLVGGVAAAQWVADGTGDGRAVAGQAEGLSISPGVPTVALFPGQSGDIALTISNGNPYDVAVVALSVDGPVTADDPACEAAGHQVTADSVSGEWVVPADGSLDVTLAGAAHMGADAASECQGVSFTIPFVLG